MKTSMSRVIEGAKSSAMSPAVAAIYVLTFCLLLSGAAPNVLAQHSSYRGTPAESQTGQSAASTYERDKIETVNLANGNFTFSIPLATVGGRGAASFTLALTYNSKVWSAQDISEAIATNNGAVGTPLVHHSAMYDKFSGFEPGPLRLDGGWTILTTPAIKGKLIGVDRAPTNTCHHTTDGMPDCGFRYALTKMWLSLPDGSQVELRDSKTEGAPAKTTHIDDNYHFLEDRDRGRIWHSFDGSGVTFVADPEPTAWIGDVSTPSGWVFLSDGTRMRMVLGFCTKIVDANGNFININASPQFNTLGGVDSSYVDELGRETLLHVSADGVVTVTSRGYMGALDRSITVETGSIGDNLRADYQNIQRPFTTGDITKDQFGNTDHGIQGPHTDLFAQSEGKAYGTPTGDDVGARKAVKRLNLMDGRSFNFRYNQYGELAEIVYPGGGLSQIDYAGAESSLCDASVLGSLNHRVGERRMLTDGTNVDATWTYAEGQEQVGGTFIPVVTVEVHQGGNAGALLSSERHFFKALNAEYTICGVLLTGTGNEKWYNAKEFRTETTTGTGTIVTATNWEQRAQVAWANDVGSSVNDYAQQQGMEVDLTNDPRVTWEETTLENGKKKRVEYGYDQFNNVTSIKEYDFIDASESFDALPPRTPLRQTIRTYVGDAPAAGGTPSHNGYCYTNLNPSDASCDPLSLASNVETIIHQKHLLLSEEIKDGAGNRESYVEYAYDSYRNENWNDGPPDANGGMTMWDGTRFGGFDAVHQPRGNVTSVRSWIEGSEQNQSAVYAASYSRYDNAGNVVGMKDALNSISKIAYADDFGDGTSPGGTLAGPNGSTFAFPTLMTNPLGQTARTQYDYTLGAATGIKDANGVVARTERDQVGRAVRMTASLGLAEQAVTELIYPTASSNAAMVSKQLDSTRWLASKTDMDGFDRPVLEAKAEDGQHASQATFTIFTKTVYDALGRVKLMTNPYRSQSASTDGWTRTTYDLNGRVTEVATFAGGVSAQPPDAGTNSNWTGSVVTTYASEQTTVRDQANKQRRSTVDGLGRLKSVDEMSEYPSTSVYATTSYDYDARGNLKAVHQGQQTRSFTYDGKSRLKSFINPEACQQGQSQCVPVPVNYTYDLNGNLHQKTDARNITTTYQYDAMNRVTSRTYSDSTPTVNYYYDSQTLPAGAPAFGRGKSVGRLVAVTYGGGTLGSYTGGYDSLGRPGLSRQITDTGTAEGVKTYAMAYDYDLAGNLKSETYPSGRTVATRYDAAGRIAGVQDQATTLYYVGGDPGVVNNPNFIAYAAGGAVLKMSLGNGLWEHTNLNSRLQPTQIGLGTSGADSSTFKLDYAYGADDSHNNGNVRTQTITGPGAASPFLQSYSYDALNRLQSAEETINTTSNWKQVYSYDQYGNRVLTTGTSYPAQLNTANNPAVSAANNRITSAGYSYDSAGNLLCDPVHQCAQGQSSIAPYYEYDAENEVKTAGGAPASGGAVYHYDGNGQRVKKIVGTVTTVFVHDTAGRLVAEYSNEQHLPQTTPTSYLTQDTLGSTRIVTGQSQEIKGRYDYLPFGEEVSSGRAGYGGNIRQKFTQKERDTETGLDYFQSRYYSSGQGRFTSVDPYIVVADTRPAKIVAYLADPQRWNRYDYVSNNPLNRVDPDGRNWFYIKSEKRWIYADGDTTKYNGKTYHSNTVYMLFVVKMGQNKDGGTSVGLVLYKQNAPIRFGGGFSGGTGSRNPIPDGSYQINLTKRGTLGSNDVVKLQGEYYTKPFYGVQEIPSSVKVSDGFVDPQREWGTKRLYLSPLSTSDPSNENFNYLHGKVNTAHGDTTHACVCDRTEVFSNYLFKVDPKESPTVGVSVTTHTEERKE